jgi:valyl-tRNA synthetase
VHRSSWPVADDVAALAKGADGAVLHDTSVVLAAVRKAKSEAKTSMRTKVASATVSGPREALDRVALAAEDLRATGRVGDLEFRADESHPLTATVTL